jgi:prophage antirepressor-like protein
MFGDVQCDFYSNDDVLCMTSEQLGQALEYADPQKGIDNLVSRNEYLRDTEFSVTLKLRATDGKLYDTRVFTEDGIYEVTMLAKTEKAKVFRAFVRKTLKGLRTGQLQIIQPITEQNHLAKMAARAKEMNAQARLNNSLTRKATVLLKERDNKRGVLSTQAVELLTINALEIITGENTLPRPVLPNKLYSATEIAEEVGCTIQMVGTTANRNGLKKPEYGMWVLDKAKYSDKQVQTFKYNETGSAKLIQLLNLKLGK